MDRHIGAQLFTIRDHMKTIEDFYASMKKIREIGYSVVQISGTPLKAEDMKKVLDEFDLKCVVTHRGFQDLKADLGAIMEYNRILGCDSCSIGMAPLEYFKTADGVSTFIREVNEMADRLSREGMLFGYHNHNIEFVKYGERTIMDRLLKETDPDKVKFIVDTYWLQLGGQDPAAFIRKMGSRAFLVHFKDLRLDPETPFTPEFAEIGQGNLDFDEIIRACDEVGTRTALVEQDTCRRDPFESLKISYEYLTTKGFE